MSKELLIKKLKKGTILRPKFETLTTNNKITFSEQGIAVVYAPNGAGKTTIAKIFQGESQTEITAEFEGNEYTSMEGQPLFHVINDQISRNIIEGTTDEFVLGEDIAKERQAKAALDQAYLSLMESIKEKLKNNFKITKQSTPFIDVISETIKSKIVCKFLSYYRPEHCHLDYPARRSPVKGKGYASASRTLDWMPDFAGDSC